MNTRERITLSRDCEAILIPSGEKIKLPAGTVVRITQSLGGAYTVTTDHGYMARVADSDADALGIEAKTTQPEAPAPASGPELEKLVWEQMRTVYDPEIPVNVVDLGLVYSCEITPLPEGGNKAEVKMTLTAPGCGMGDVLRADAERKIASIPGIKAVDVQMVIDPPWNPGMMSDAAKLELGML
jgi:probable FeS assembly SUF system protein SufT